MNNNMQPFFPQNPNMQANFPQNQNPFFQQGVGMDNPQIRNLENRVFNLEKEVMNLRNKISRLENSHAPYQDNYTSNYNPNSYNMM